MLKNMTMRTAYVAAGIQIGDLNQFYEVISISNVAVPEGASIFAIASADSVTPSGSSLSFRHKANDTYGGAGGFFNTDLRHFEAPCLWSNFTAGTYNFSFECMITPGYRTGVGNIRLTLIITWSYAGFVQNEQYGFEVQKSDNSLFSVILIESKIQYLQTEVYLLEVWKFFIIVLFPIFTGFIVINTLGSKSQKP
jgi:hypothetical protein